MTVPRIGGTAPAPPPVHTGPIGTPGDVPRVRAGAPTPVAGVAPVPFELAGRLAGTAPEPLATADLTLVLETATRALQQGRATDVLAVLDRLWSETLSSDSPWYLRAAALEVLGRTADAETVLRNAVARLPRSAALLYLLGVHASGRQQPDAALVASTHALRVHPDEPLLLVQHAALLQARGDHAAASGLLARARARAPQLPVDLWMLSLSELADPSRNSGSRRTPSLTPMHVPALDAMRDGSADIADDPEAQGLLARTARVDATVRALVPRVMAAPCTPEALSLLRDALSLARAGRSAELHLLLTTLAEAGDAVMRARGDLPGRSAALTPDGLRRITPLQSARVTPTSVARVTPSPGGRGTPGGVRVVRATPRDSLATRAFGRGDAEAAAAAGERADGTRPSVETAVRFGLALLDSPADAALRATRGRVRATPLSTEFVPGMFGTASAGNGSQPTRARGLAWPSLVLGGGVIIAALMPSLRVPGVVLAVAGLVMIARRSGR